MIIHLINTNTLCSKSLQLQIQEPAVGGRSKESMMMKFVTMQWHISQHKTEL
jgi:hypothetical protein